MILVERHPLQSFSTLGLRETQAELGLGCLFQLSGIHFGGSKTEKNRIPEDFFFSVFSGGIFHRNVVWGRSQEFLFLDAITGIFHRNSCGTGIPLFSPDSSGILWILSDSSGFLGIPRDSSGFLGIPPDSSGFLFPPKAVWLRPATKEGSLLSKILTKIDLFNLPQKDLTMVSAAPVLCWRLLA
jgi:hypothetical protein